MEATNESLKNISQAKELLKEYLVLNDADNEALLYLSLELLDKSLAILSKTL